MISRMAEPIMCVKLSKFVGMVGESRVTWVQHSFFLLLRPWSFAKECCTTQGVNSIDIKNLRPVFGPVFGPKLRPILVLYFQFHISGQFSGPISGPNLCQLNWPPDSRSRICYTTNPLFRRPQFFVDVSDLGKRKLEPRERWGKRVKDIFLACAEENGWLPEECEKFT